MVHFTRSQFKQKASLSFCTSIMLVFLLGLSVGMVFLNQIDALVCSIGLEPDPSADNRYRWVIPVEDPCRCTELRPGGMNTRTPGRNFKVIYFDISMSTAHELHRWLNCSTRPAGNEGRFTRPVSADGTHSTSGPRPPTNDAPLAGACEDAEHGQTFADPNDCTMYFQCEWNVLYHNTCLDMYFNPDSFVCDYYYNVDCNVHYGV